VKPARILTVAGSDSGGGAGIQADLKTIERLGGFAMTAVTAVTAQNTLGVHGVWSLPPDAVERQIAAVADDIGVDAVKTGMLDSAALVRTVAAVLRRLGVARSGAEGAPAGTEARSVAVGARPVPLVVDPVMVAKGGQALLAEEARGALRDELLPLAALVTPNVPEAEVLTGLPAGTLEQRELVARRLVELGAGAALVKGGHTEGETVVDLLFDGHEVRLFSAARVPTRHTHGTGCTLSAAIATGLGQGLPLAEAVERGIRYVQAAIAHAPGLGAGHGPLGHAAGQAPWT